MAKPLPKASVRRKSFKGAQRSFSTPAGVWVIVGMATLFAAGGVATGIFVGLKSVAEKERAALPAPRVDRQESPEAQLSAGVDASAALNAEEQVSSPVVSDPAEQDTMRQEVLNRIDLMRSLSQNDKDKLYAQVERARGFRKIAVISFSKSGFSPNAGQVDALVRQLKEPEMRKLIGDPTVLLVMVGFADRQGDEAKNLEVSRARAESVIKALREKLDVPNVMHSVGMGGQKLFDQTNPEKNRLVEVWAVQS
jgi:outer membrane protein OmpA-like peptidoglycan-associated protein